MGKQMMDKRSIHTGGIAQGKSIYILHHKKKKNSKVIVRGDACLKGKEGLFCCPDLTSEVCCLPVAWLRDIAQKVTHLVCPSDYYLLLLFYYFFFNWQ